MDMGLNFAASMEKVEVVAWVILRLKMGEAYMSCLIVGGDGVSLGG